ncbi:MAG: AAA family ATPase [Parachlamydiaceae bacterium]|nr:AAA family ATPase [Parachlamydiaceae bacterium]
MNIILCGLPMSGKSTIGKLVAEKLNRQFIDTDRLIENTYNMIKNKKYTCRQIYFLEGEKVFRRLEDHQIASLKNVKKSVIAIGGGSLINEGNIKILQDVGSLVYLKVSTELLWERMKTKALPTYLNHKNPEEEFFELAARRCPIIKNAAEFVIETDDLTEEQTVEKIIELFRDEKST